MPTKAKVATPRHFLVPTDGSPLSERAVDHAVKLAKALGAKLTAFHAIPEFAVFAGTAELLEQTPAEYKISAKAKAEKILSKIRQAAKECGVACDVESTFSDQPFKAVLAMATKKKCDLIVMASHGRRGLKGLLLGSETQKVLTHGTLPVLVVR